MEEITIFCKQNFREYEFLKFSKSQGANGENLRKPLNFFFLSKCSTHTLKTNKLNKKQLKIQ